MSALAQITYVSRRSATLAPDDARAEVGEILGVARTANPQHGVTGALLSNPHAFAQILEGPADEVERIFDRIRLDPRHHDVVVVSSRTVAERSFPDWSMGFTASSGDDEVEVASDLLERAFAAAQHGEDPDLADAVVDLIQTRISLARIW
jgi:hypothetical protein